MGQKYLDELIQKQKELETLTESYDRVIQGIEFIESFIPEFFSKSGEANEIKNMYHDINVAMESPFFDMKVNCSDIDHGYHIYSEYVEGMKEFIHDISAMNESVEFESYEDKFNTARNKDSIFIDSLYGGNLNKSVDTSITEATSNVEFLVDFIPTLKAYKETCNTLYNECMASENYSKKSELYKESIDMLFDSITHYCFETTKNILECYSDIQNVLTGKPSVVDTDTGMKLF